MIQALYTGKAGLVSNQFRMDVVANNFSNVNTNGYKSARVDFADALYQTMQRPLPSQGSLNLELGHGVHVAATTRAFKQGALTQSGRKIDLALVGQGYFAVRDANGKTLYTRDGNFHISHEEDADYLVTFDGMYVLDADGRPVTLPVDISQLSIGEDGTLTEQVAHKVIELDTEAEDDRFFVPVPYGKLGIYEFPNSEGLLAVGGNYFEETDNSGAPELSAFPEVRQGYLEASTTDMADEMTQMILAQRAYQFAGRVVSTADEMEGIANNLRR